MHAHVVIISVDFPLWTVNCLRIGRSKGPSEMRQGCQLKPDCVEWLACQISTDGFRTGKRGDQKQVLGTQLSLLALSEMDWRKVEQGPT